MNKRVIIIGGFLILFFSTALFQFRNIVQKKQVVEVSLISITQRVIIDGKDTQSVIKIKKGATALQLLSTNHLVVTKGEKENAFVTKIDQKEALANNKEFWAFYVNGKQAAVGAGSYVAQNNDTIEWKIETY